MIPELPENRILAQSGSVILGCSVAAMVCALREAERGQGALLITSSTCLYDELFSAGDIRIPRVPDPAWQDLLFPPETVAEGLLHPDRLKRHGERLLEQRGVSILYACQAVGWADGIAVIAAKSGLFGIRYGRLFDCRTLPLDPPDSYILHTMHEGIHHITLLPTDHPGGAAGERYLRYRQALDQLPEDHTLARGGTESAAAKGADIAAEIRFGLDIAPSAECPEGGEPAAESPAEEGCDILIVGGGTAGAAAALFSARQGHRTVLLEMNRQLGGTGTAGGVSTYWFGRRTGATKIIDEAVAEARERWHQPARPGLWNDDDGFAPDLKAHVLLELCLNAGVDVRFGCIVCGAETAGPRVTGVCFAQNGRLRRIRARMTIDCTGDGDVCVLAGADSVYGSARDGLTYWASLAQYPQPDTYRNNFSTMVRVDDPLDYSRFIISSRKLGEAMYNHGVYVAARETRHIRGLATVTLHDELTMAPVPDPLYMCFSNYDPKGRLTADLCYFGLLPPNQRFVIPRGAVIPADRGGRAIDGLLIGGKAISCTHDGFPGIRMQADLQNQGLALAALAGCAVEQDTAASAATGVTERIRLLGGDTDFPAAKNRPSLAAVIDSLNGEEAWEWLDAPVTACAEDPPAVIRILLADSAEALPLLRGRYRTAEAPQLRLALARMLLWHHDPLGADTVVAAVRQLLAASAPELPRRAGSLNYGQMLPDHGLMPEAVYLLNALAHAPDTDIRPLMADVLDRLTSRPRDWYDLRAGIYCWCECFGRLAAFRRDAALIPMIRQILSWPEFRVQSEDPLLSERLHMLAISLYHALHSLGCGDGTEGLRSYLREPRAALREAARQLLEG